MLLFVGCDVMFCGSDDMFDCYGWQGVLIFVGGSELLVQVILLVQGVVMVFVEIVDKDCVVVLMVFEVVVWC